MLLIGTMEEIRDPFSEPNCVLHTRLFGTLTIVDSQNEMMAECRLWAQIQTLQGFGLGEPPRPLHFVVRGCVLGTNITIYKIEQVIRTSVAYTHGIGADICIWNGTLMGGHGTEPILLRDRMGYSHPLLFRNQDIQEAAGSFGSVTLYGRKVPVTKMKSSSWEPMQGDPIHVWCLVKGETRVGFPTSDWKGIPKLASGGTSCLADLIFYCMATHQEYKVQCLDSSTQTLFHLLAQINSRRVLPLEWTLCASLDKGTLSVWSVQLPAQTLVPSHDSVESYMQTLDHLDTPRLNFLLQKQARLILSPARESEGLPIVHLPLGFVPCWGSPVRAVSLFFNTPTFSGATEHLSLESFPTTAPTYPSRCYLIQQLAQLFEQGQAELKRRDEEWQIESSILCKEEIPSDLIGTFLTAILPSHGLPQVLSRLTQAEWWALLDHRSMMPILTRPHPPQTDTSYGPAFLMEDTLYVLALAYSDWSGFRRLVPWDHRCPPQDSNLVKEMVFEDRKKTDPAKWTPSRRLEWLHVHYPRDRIMSELEKAYRENLKRYNEYQAKKKFIAEPETLEERAIREQICRKAAKVWADHVRVRGTMRSKPIGTLDVVSLLQTDQDVQRSKVTPEACDLLEKCILESLFGCSKSEPLLETDGSDYDREAWWDGIHFTVDYFPTQGFDKVKNRMGHVEWDKVEGALPLKSIMTIRTNGLTWNHEPIPF